MNNCDPIEMPVCEHCVPIKFHCNKCGLNKISLNAWGEVEVRPVSPIIEQIQKLEERIKKLEEISSRHDELHTEWWRRLDEKDDEIKRLKERTQEIWATT